MNRSQHESHFNMGSGGAWSICTDPVKKALEIAGGRRSQCNHRSNSTEKALGIRQIKNPSAPRAHPRN